MSQTTALPLLVNAKNVVAGTYTAEQRGDTNFDLVSTTLRKGKIIAGRRKGYQSTRREGVIKCTMLPALNNIDPLLAEAARRENSTPSVKPKDVPLLPPIPIAAMRLYPGRGGIRDTGDLMPSTQEFMAWLTKPDPFRGRRVSAGRSSRGRSGKSSSQAGRRSGASQAQDLVDNCRMWSICFRKRTFNDHSLTIGYMTKCLKEVLVIDDAVALRKAEAASKQPFTTLDSSEDKDDQFEKAHELRSMGIDVRVMQGNFLEHSRQVTSPDDDGGDDDYVRGESLERHNTYGELFRTALRGTDCNSQQSPRLLPTPEAWRKNTARKSHLSWRHAKEFTSPIIPTDSVEHYFNMEKERRKDQEHQAALARMKAITHGHSSESTGKSLAEVASAASAASGKAGGAMAKVQQKLEREQTTATDAGGDLDEDGEKSSLTVSGPASKAGGSLSRLLSKHKNTIKVVSHASITEGSHVASAREEPEHNKRASIALGDLARARGTLTGAGVNPSEPALPAHTKMVEDPEEEEGADKADEQLKSKVTPVRKEACQMLRFFVFGAVGNENSKNSKDKDRIYHERVGCKEMVLTLHGMWQKLDADNSGRCDIGEFREFAEQHTKEMVQYAVQDLMMIEEAERPPWLKEVAHGSSEDTHKFVMKLCQRLEVVLLGKKSSFAFEDMFRVIWPAANAHDVKAMKKWCHEFAAATAKARVKTPPVLPAVELEALCSVFHAFDEDGSGSVTFEELIQKGLIYEDNADDFVKEWDINGDGELNCLEFCDMMCPSGYRAYENSKMGSTAAGLRVMYDPYLHAWRVTEHGYMGEDES
eukprot:gnl/TRDRNA2_/TRDRNA2_174442_c6_seq22.p1 gnl/TRDRNA2_/TRDRNA2_174442_c6~~gnl/TRDRNA2_/TRDRNA2_174442_c6_seq22.p1  ORF type:complete len:816 (+),score=152.94 gnl/TRDRNA2_/TRDRNA2_174442_c6_seq22:91-2538(+)